MGFLAFIGNFNILLLFANNADFFGSLATIH